MNKENNNIDQSADNDQPSDSNQNPGINTINCNEKVNVYYEEKLQNDPNNSNNKILLIEGTDKKNNENIKKTLKENSINYLDINSLLNSNTQSNLPLIVKLDTLTNFAFVLVLLTPDNFFYLKDNGKPTDALLCSNQRTIFLFGFFLSKLGRDKVIALYYDQKSFRLPTQFFDANYLAFNKTNSWTDQIKSKLINMNNTN